MLIPRKPLQRFQCLSSSVADARSARRARIGCTMQHVQEQYALRYACNLRSAILLLAE
jgi:hypothetical protein